MKKKLIIITGILLVILASQYVPKNTNQAERPQEPVVVFQHGDFFDTTGRYSIENDKYTVSAQIPINVHQDTYNKIEQEIKSEIIDFENYAKDNPTEFPWALEITTNSYTAHNIHSYVSNIYSFTGGAHPNTYTRSIHQNAITNEIITFEDILPRIGVMAHFLSAAQENLIIHFEEGISPTNMENWSNWFIEDDALVFIFDPYQIAPYAVGRQTIAFNINNIKHLIKPIYQ